MSDNEQQDERIEDLEVDEDDAEDVKGGVRPTSPPAGPIPIPYPN